LLLGAAVGAALAVAGAVMQGLFRNPLADPGLIGVSSGAGFAAAAAIVLGGRLLPETSLPFAILPFAAFFGALASTLVLYAVASRGGRTSMAVMLLAGIAFAALAGAGIGWLSYISNDSQLRDLTFWSLGSLGGATWGKVAVVIPMILPVLLAVPFLAHGLNAMALGEAEAFHIGVNVQRLKVLSVLLVSVAVGAAVACSGLIGFVGIIVPHMLRLSVGANYRFLLPASALLGATLLVGADIFARIIVAPSELPIGIVTATLGAPFFIWLLLRRGAEFSA
jgi:iron complex transport system permease protein